VSTIFLPRPTRSLLDMSGGTSRYAPSAPASALATLLDVEHVGRDDLGTARREVRDLLRVARDDAHLLASLEQRARRDLARVPVRSEDDVHVLSPPRGRPRSRHPD
jgi:hypothetical protein